MYFSYHYKIIKTVNKEHFISLELSNRKDNTSVLCADYDVWLEITQALIPNTHIDYGHRWCHVSRIYFVFYDWEVQKATVTWSTKHRHNKKYEVQRSIYTLLLVDPRSPVLKLKYSKLIEHDRSNIGYSFIRYI